MNGPETKKQISSNSLTLIKGDITEMAVDAIVNAANKDLILGGGVAGAIRKKGGPGIQDECNRIGGTFVGGAVITNAGMLKAKYVIHAVGPIMGEGDEDEKLKSAVQNSLKRAEENQLKNLAFPAISTGIFGYPLDRCAEIMVAEIASFLQTSEVIKEVFICLWDDNAFSVFEKELTDNDKRDAIS